MLAASLLHASWHALIKVSSDRVLALAGMNLVSGAIALSLLPFSRALPAAAFLVIALSVLLHAGYKIALARLYGQAELGQAYPLARGLTPIIATGLSVALLGDILGTATLAAIAVICAGLLMLAAENRSPLSATAAGSAALVGLTVAAYSVLDAYGVRLAGDWFSFTLWLVAADSGAFVAYAVATRGALAWRTWRSRFGGTLLSGALGVSSFGVFMWALGRAPVGPVSALRETSVLFAALIGALFLGEQPSWRRYVAATAIAAGIAVLGLAR